MERAGRLVYSVLAHETGYTGRGITAAVIDTGIGSHPDISSERVLAFADFVGNRLRAYDDSGHGTHVCGIIGGSGRLNTQIRGIAPECGFVVLKALNSDGDGSPNNIIAALRWVKNYSEKYHIRVINLSFGADCDTEDEDYFQMSREINEIWKSGVCVVCSAGNMGPEKGSITFPGCCKQTITVGAMERKMQSGQFSGRGPSPYGVMKPDLVAPAGNIQSLAPLVYEQGHWQRFTHSAHGRSELLWDQRQWEQRLKGVRERRQMLEAGYVRKSGTSMSAPMVTGAICLLLQKEPTLLPEQVRKRLWNSCTPLGYPMEQQGHGMLNLKQLL